MRTFRKAHNGFNLIELLLVVAIIGILAAGFFGFAPRASAAWQWAPGDDVVSDAVVSNLTLILTNGTTGTLIITNTVVYNAVSPSTGHTNDSLRVSISIGPDPTTDFYVSPAPPAATGPGTTNNIVVSGNATNYPWFGACAGIPVLHGVPTPTNTFFSSRESIGLINTPIAISAAASVTKSNAVILTIPIKDFWHQSL